MVRVRDADRALVLEGNCLAMRASSQSCVSKTQTKMTSVAETLQRLEPERFRTELVLFKLSGISPRLTGGLTWVLRGCRDH